MSWSAVAAALTWVLAGARWAVLVACVGVAAAAVGHRAAARAALRRSVVVALQPLLGYRMIDDRTVACRRWRGRGTGTPTRVRIRYSSRVDDTDPEWRPRVVATVARRFQADYRVRAHRPRHNMLVLELNPPGDAVPVPVSRARVDRTISELLGPTAQVTHFELDDHNQPASFAVRHEASTKLAALPYRMRVERVVSTVNPGRWRAQWDLQQDTVRFEQRPPLPECVWVPDQQPDDLAELMSNYSRFRVPIGVDEDGTEICWQPARIPHLMVVGATGSGKTSTAHGIISYLTRAGTPVWILDAKRVEFLDFRDWPNVQLVAGSPATQTAMIYRLHQIMEHRYERIESGQARVEDFEPLFAVLDEFAEFRSSVREWYTPIKGKGAPTVPPVLTLVNSLARMARKARIHLVLLTQRPDTEFLGGGEMRDNFGMRVSLGRLSPDGAKMMWENVTVGTTLPRGKVGRAMATSADGAPVEVQTYRFPEFGSDDVQQATLLERLRPPQAHHPRLVVVPPAEALTGDDVNDEPPEPGYLDYATTAWDYATNRPDLDPLQAGTEVDDGLTPQQRASALAALGLLAAPDLPTKATVHPAEEVEPGHPQETQPASLSSQPHGRHGHLRVVSPPSPSTADDLDLDVTDDLTEDEDGYLGVEQADPNALCIGDLIETDPGTWVVVDEDVYPDPVDEGMLLLSWRSDADESGLMSVPEDSLINCRRPHIDQVDDAGD